MGKRSIIAEFDGYRFKAFRILRNYCETLFVKTEVNEKWPSEKEGCYPAGTCYATYFWVYFDSSVCLKS